MRSTEPSRSARLRPIILDACHAGPMSIAVETTARFTAVTLITVGGQLPLFTHEARRLADALNRVAIHVELEVVQ